MSIGIQKLDEVICPFFTFFATAASVVRHGAKPVFVDIDLADFNISTENIRKKITQKTKAILLVHVFGQTASVDKIMDLGHEFSIPIIEDCAQSFGTKRHGKQSGTLGKSDVLDVIQPKILEDLEIRAVFVPTMILSLNKIKIPRVHGMKPQYFHRYISGNFRIDEIQAALLNIKLPHVET